jgi:diguanylate cyclase (GGDEF)-like protein
LDVSETPQIVAAYEPAEPTQLDGQDVGPCVPLQRTPGSGPFGPDDPWDVMHRPAFVKRLEDRIESGEPVTIVAFGMDRFQQLNVAAGLEAGDVALRNAYRVLRWMLGPSNVAYFGSDCFAALLPDDKTTAGLVDAALDRLACTDLSDHLTALFATASAGMVVVDDPAVTADDVLYEAECALRSAKEMGGNRATIERFPTPYTVRAASA